jgi:hypothetical protein
VAARPHVAPALARRRDQLQHHLPDEQHHGAGDVGAVGEEGAVAGIGRALLGEPADGQQRAVGLARQQVAAARAAAGEQPVAARVPALDLQAVVGIRARQHPRRLLLDPAERRDVLVRAEQDAGLAGARLRREVRLPRGERVGAVGEPARHRRRRAVAHGAPQHRQGEAVDLQQQQPRLVGLHRWAGSPRDAAGHRQRVGVVVVHARDDRDRRAHGRCDQRHEQRVPEAAERDRLGRDLGREPQDQRVEREHQQEAGRDGERQPQRRDQRRQDRVQHGDDRGDQQRAPEAVDARARRDARRREQRERGEQPREQEPQRTQPRPNGTPRERLDVLHVGCRRRSVAVSRVIRHHPVRVDRNAAITSAKRLTASGPSATLSPTIAVCTPASASSR